MIRLSKHVRASFVTRLISDMLQTLCVCSRSFYKPPHLTSQRSRNSATTMPSTFRMTRARSLSPSRLPRYQVKYSTCRVQCRWTRRPPPEAPMSMGSPPPSVSAASSMSSRRSSPTEMALSQLPQLLLLSSVPTLDVTKLHVARTEKNGATSIAAPTPTASTSALQRTVHPGVLAVLHLQR